MQETKRQLIKCKEVNNNTERLKNDRPKIYQLSPKVVMETTEIILGYKETGLN